MSKKGRDRKRRKAHKARAKAKARAAKAAKACQLCHEGERHLRQFKVVVDGKTLVDWRACRSCVAVLDVLLTDRRNHQRPWKG